jgi:nucleotide-binding universal stress UspA family protein
MMSGSSSPTEEATNAQRVTPPFCKILVPLDGSPLAEEALPVALAFAKHAGASGKLVLVHARRVELPAFSRGGAKEMPLTAPSQIPYLGRIAQDVREQGVEVEVIDTEGDPAGAIVDLARELHVDLIVLVTHAREGLSRLLYGSVADRVLQEAPVPVLLLKHGEYPALVFVPEEHPHLLLPLDGSELAESVVPLVISLASHIGASVTLLRSLDMVELVAEGMHEQERKAAERGVLISTERQQAMRYLEQIQARFQALGIPTATLVTEGSAAEDIAEQAKVLEQTGNAVMMVMATHGRSSASRWLYGSVAGAVLHLVTIPLLVIRPR